MPYRWRVVVAFTGIVVACAVGVLYVQHTRRVKEALLKEDLQTMREAIENYTTYEEVAPQSLDLVRLHYLYEIPTDPVCPQMNWEMHFGESDLIVGLELKRVRGAGQCVFQMSRYWHQWKGGVRHVADTPVIEESQIPLNNLPQSRLNALRAKSSSSHTGGFAT